MIEFGDKKSNYMYKGKEGRLHKHTTCTTSSFSAAKILIIADNPLIKIAEMSTNCL